jgi:3-oxoadipate enol-lactonase
MWCDTLPASPSGAKAAWDERMGIVRRANSLEPIADPTMERWFTDAFKTKSPRRWRQIRDTIAATTPAGYLGCSAAILDFDFVPRLGTVKVPTLVVCGADDPGTPAPENRKLAGLVPGARYEEIAGMRHFPNVEAPDAFNKIMLGWLEAQKRLN